MLGHQQNEKLKYFNLFEIDKEYQVSAENKIHIPVGANIFDIKSVIDEEISKAKKLEEQKQALLNKLNAQNNFSFVE